MATTANLKLEDMLVELSSLKTSYRHQLIILTERVARATADSNVDRYSDHDAFNMSATCQNLAAMAGKIEQTTNVIRWMNEATTR